MSKLRLKEVKELAQDLTGVEPGLRTRSLRLSTCLIAMCLLPTPRPTTHTLQTKVSPPERLLKPIIATNEVLSPSTCPNAILKVADE